MKVLILYSGGLDSLIASFWANNAGFDTLNVFIETPFNSSERPAYFAKKYKLNYEIYTSGEDYIDLVKNPVYGKGKNLNPCIDCHAYMIRKTGEMLEKKRASFLVTGDVLSQRPMSQRKDGLKAVDKLSGYGELTVRPLSGRILAQTTPEKMGWIKREEMFLITGRSRSEQLVLAKKYGIDEYDNSAGGCLLTDINFSKRASALLQKQNFTGFDAEIVKLGRHFKTQNSTHVILGRNREENKKLCRLKREEDSFITPQSVKAPSALVLFSKKEEDIKTAADLMRYYSKSEDDNFFVFCGDIKKESVKKLSKQEVERMKIY